MRKLHIQSITMSKKFNLYVGKAGQLYVMSEFLMLYFSVEKNKVTCKKQDFTAFVNNFSDFPIVVH